MTELNYREYSENVLSKIRDTKNIVIATCADNIVTTRMVAHLLYDNSIVFSTGGKSFKVSQIRENPNVSFFLEGLNIEAVASLCGHPDTHPAFETAYEEKYPEYVKLYGYDPDDVAVAAKIKKIQIYTYHDKACKDIIDFEAEKAYRIEL